jgi:hypothetical protein
MDAVYFQATGGGQYFLAVFSLAARFRVCRTGVRGVTATFLSWFRKGKGVLIAFMSSAAWSMTLVMLAALWLRLRGIDWPRFHHDEHIIAAWIARGGPDRVYPGGLFVLIQPFRWLWELTAFLWGAANQFLAPGAAHATSTDFIRLGRVFNALLGSLACGLVYLTALRLTCSRAAAILAGLLMCFSQYAIEHAHYAQSDIPMLFMISLVVWLWVRHVDRPTLRGFVMVGVGLGFAAGTKFTLMISIIPWLFYCGWQAWCNKDTRWTALPRTVILGALFFGVGFIWATPAALDWSEFSEGMAYERQRVYGETIRNMGPEAGNRSLRYQAHWTDLGRAARTMGWGWLSLSVLGLTAFFCQRLRRYAVPVLGLLATYLLYYVFLAPWVRTQEFLPLVPFLALLTVLPTASGVARSSSWRIRFVLLILFALALPETMLRGVRVSSVFAWMDTRERASRWLQRHEPDGLHVGTEPYAMIAPRGWRSPSEMAARVGLEGARRQGYDLFVSQGTPAYRGMDHPVTKQLYPDYAVAYDVFMEGVTHLRSWSLLPDRSSRTTFNSIQLELFGLNPSRAAVTVDTWLPQPGWVSHQRHETYQAHGSQLGARALIPVTDRPTVLGVSANTALEHPVWVAVFTKERGATIRINGFSQTKRLKLAAYDAVLLPFQRPLWKPRWGHIEPVRITAEPVDHVDEVACYAFISFDQREATRLLEGFRGVELAALTSGDEELVSMWPSIRAQSHDTIAYRQAHAMYYDLFARMHLLNPIDHPKASGKVIRLDMPLGSLAGRLYTHQQPWFAGFHRTVAPLSLQFHAKIVGPAGRDGLLRLVSVADQRVLAEWPLLQWPSEGARFCDVAIGRGLPGELSLRFESTHPLKIELREARLEWAFDEVLSTHYDQVLMRKAHDLIAAGEGGEAWKLLRQMHPSSADPMQFAWLRAQFAAALDAGEPITIEQSAAALLAVAPQHHEAGKVRDHEGDAAAAQDVEGTQPPIETLIFQPYLQVVGVRHDSHQDALTFVWQVLEDHPPRLNAVFCKRKNLKWRTAKKQAILPDRPVAAGERFETTFSLQGEPADSARRAIRVESDVPSMPGRLAIVGSDKTLRPLDAILAP